MALLLSLVSDQTNRDRYSRLLRYVYTADGAFVDREMVARWAQPIEYPPDRQHAVEFRAAAVDATQKGRGFWSGTSPHAGAMGYALTTGMANIRKEPGTDFEIRADDSNWTKTNAKAIQPAVRALLANLNLVPTNITVASHHIRRKESK